MKIRSVVPVILAAAVFPALVASVLWVAPCAAQQQVESVVAIVGKEVILRSELDEQVMVYCMQAGIEPSDTARVNEVTKDILTSMVNARLIVNEARERKLTATKEELDAAVQDALNEVKNRVGSDEKFAEELKKENLTEDALKARYRKELEAQILARKLVEREVSSKIKVTDKDIDDFYKERKGELPKRPPEVTLAQIVVLPDVDSLVDITAKQKALDVLQAVKSGEDFERLASQFSDDPSAEKGGDVGFFQKGEFEEAFEKAAFALEPGQVSDVVKSRYGYHIIKLVEKEGDRAHVKHILIRTVPTEDAEQRARALATSLRKRIESGEKFEDVAREFSQDPVTAPKGGVIGSYIMDSLAPPVKTAIKGLPVGGITEVIPMEIGYHIFKVESKTPERDYTFDEIKDRLRQLVIQEKSQNEYDRWVEGLKKKTFVNIKFP